MTKAFQTIWWPVKLIPALLKTFLYYVLIILALSFLVQFLYRDCPKPNDNPDVYALGLPPSPSPSSTKVDDPPITILDFEKGHDDLKYIIRDTLYTDRQLNMIKRLITESISYMISESSLPSKVRLLQDLTIYQSVSEYTSKNLYQFCHDVDTVASLVVRRFETAIKVSPLEKSQQNEQEFVDGFVSDVTPSFALLNTSGPLIEHSTLSLNDHATELKASLADGHGALHNIRGQIIENRKLWERLLDTMGFSRADTLDIERQIIILETIQPVIENVVLFTTHLNQTLASIDKNLKYLIENTLRLKKAYVDNEWYGRVIKLTLTAEKDPPELGWKGVDKGLEGVKTGLKDWKVFKDHWDQKSSDVMREDWRMNPEIFEAMQKLYEDIVSKKFWRVNTVRDGHKLVEGKFTD